MRQVDDHNIGIKVWTQKTKYHKVTIFVTEVNLQSQDNRHFKLLKLSMIESKRKFQGWDV